MKGESRAILNESKLKPFFSCIWITVNLKKNVGFCQSIGMAI